VGGALTKEIPPHDIDAEQSLLGAMMLSKEACAEALKIVTSADFYKPANSVVFNAITELYKQGEPTDSVSVCDLLRRDGTLDLAGGPVVVAECLGFAPSTSSVGRYARIVAQHSVLRRLTQIGFEMYRRAMDLGVPEDIVDAFLAAINEINLPDAKVPDGLWGVDDFLDRPLSKQAPWVVPGILRKGWRALLVAEEGVGKSLVIQQICLASAQGIHPFTLEEMPPITTLLIDLENPEDRLDAGFQMIIDPIKNGNYRRNQAYLWHQPGGLNIRHRADRAKLEAVIAAVRPQLVAIGPLYKAYRTGAHESDEQAAEQVQSVLDDLRTRYGFALLLEHHAPKKQNGVRELAPYGSSFWLRWPEFGLSLARDPDRNRQDEDNVFKLGRFRRDRISGVPWPDHLAKASFGMPWSASWTDDRWKGYGTPTPPVVANKSPVDVDPF
jgi:hypothetical protein